MNNDAIIYSKQQILVGPISKHASIFKPVFLVWCELGLITNINSSNCRGLYKRLYLV